MNRVVSSTLMLLLLITTFLAPLTAANEQPLADAGLDQHVARGSTVLLDATGSHDPDGHIERYEWSIHTPDNRTITPNCRTCPRTRFHPNAVGRYTVFLTIADEDGTKSHDKLYVTVSPGEGPSAKVSGPQTPHVGEQAVYSVTVDAGAAPLDHVVWSLDGNTLATDSLSGGSDARTLTRTFSSAGTRTLTATVYDTDGQTDTNTQRISVQGNRTPPPRNTLGDRFTPTIVGDDLVTGKTPLQGTYRLRFAAISNQVRSIKWFGDGARLATGRSLTTKWEPGDHSLYALVTYSDGSRDIARFSGGSTTVTADPKPTIKLPSISSFRSVSGRAYASDAYANLESVHVTLGRKEIGQTEMDAVTPGGMQRHRTVSFDSKDFKSGKKYTLTVIATDERGQKSTLTRTITPSKMPKIVKSEFINNNVDSYNTRIDPKRYTAHHVTKIKLNGVDPSDIHHNQKTLDSNVSLLSEKDVVKNGELYCYSTWAARTPGKYSISRDDYLKRDNSHAIKWRDKETLRLNVTPSPPEIRLDVTNDGTTGYGPLNWGIVVDASDSFDPDHTKLRYTWMKGAQPIAADNKTAKFSSFDFAELELKDQYGLTATKRFNYLEDYVPAIQSVKVLSKGPYKPNDTVRLQVSTEPYRFSKNRYHLHYNLGLSVRGVSDSVMNWNKRIVRKINDSSGDISAPRQYTGTVEIPASQLFNTDSQPKLRVYNGNHPETYKEVKIPHVTVYRSYGKQWSNPRIQSTSYLVNRPTYDWVSTKSPAKRNQYTSNGYNVYKKTRNGYEYTVQKRTKVQDAKYKDVEKTFSTKLQQSAFLQKHPDWKPKSRTAKKRTYTTTEHEWHDSKSGRGTFTGDTRQIKTSPARYRTLNRYAHRSEVQKTETETRTKYVRKCTPYGICMDVPHSYTYTHSYTVTRTNYYWAPRKYHYDDWATGGHKRQKIEDAHYDTQYYYRYEVKHTEVHYTYHVHTSKKVRDAQYKWKDKLTTQRGKLARSYARAKNWRVGEAKPNVHWDLKKRTGSKTTTSNVYLDSDTVLKTYVTAKVDIVQQYATQNGKIKNESVGSKIVHQSYQNLLTKPDLRKRLNSHREKSNGTDKEGLHYY